MTEHSTEFSPSLREQILEAVSRTVRTRFFDPNFNGRDWQSLVQNARDQILRAQEPVEFESSVDELLKRLSVHPVGFFHQTRAKVPFHHVLRATLFPRNGNWVFQDVQEDGAAHAAGIKPGDSLTAVNDEPVVPPESVRFPAGREASIVIRRRGGAEERIVPSAPPAAVARKQSVRASVLYDGVGYLKITRFPGLVGVDMARDIDSAIQELSECRAAVIDLRGNPGGGSANLRLMSYLTPDKRPVGYSLTRPRAERGYRREELAQFRRIPYNKLALVWLALRFKFADKSIVVVTEGMKPPRFQGRVVLLVNEHTVSGAEIVAGFVKDHRLAVIVGSRTAGRLYGWSSFPIQQQYRLTIPVSNYLTWEGKCFEGSGIAPDVEVPFSPEAALEGRDHQLEEGTRIAASL
jgi:C-terminal processing protease CtpA/Prc